MVGGRSIAERRRHPLTRPGNALEKWLQGFVAGHSKAGGRAADTWAEVAGRIKSLYAQYWLTHRALQLARDKGGDPDTTERIRALVLR